MILNKWRWERHASVAWPRFFPYICFFTDGAYSPQEAEAGDILTPEQQLRDNGRGAGGIVFFPTNRYGPHGPVYPILIRVTSRQNEPGMNAFTWELVTQLIALNLAKFLPPYVYGFTDCKAAMARTNRATTSYVDQLAHTRGGLYSSAMHHLALSGQIGRFSWVKGHPERDKERKDLTSRKDIGIFMADRVADGDMKTLHEKGLHSICHTLNFENVLNEIIPPNQWHFRTLDSRKLPILDDLIHHQHRAQMHAYQLKRDKGNPSGYWSSTNLEFAHKTHPLSSNSFWTAARRTLVTFN